MKKKKNNGVVRVYAGKINEVEVYREYLKALGTKGSTVTKLSKELGISRAKLYVIVNKVEEGDEIQLNRCLTKGRYNCLWEYRYQRRFFVIEETSGDKHSQLTKALIRDMHKDGFGVRDIARRVGKDPATVSYHLKK